MTFTKRLQEKIPIEAKKVIESRDLGIRNLTVLMMYGLHCALLQGFARFTKTTGISKLFFFHPGQFCVHCKRDRKAG